MKQFAKTALSLLTLVLLLTILTGCAEIDTTQTENPKVEPTPSIFDSNCGISASAEIGNNIINFPEIKITITNTSDKDISAIQFYSVPYDVYGDKLYGLFAQNHLSTDTSIAVGETTTLTYQFLDQSVKNVELYVYSVYFADGTEWGNKDAPSYKIVKEAPTIEVTVVS